MSHDLRERTKAFAFSAIGLVRALPSSATNDVLSRQLVKAATSVAANYRAAGRARSPREFVAKLGLVREEADECEFWLETLIECHPSRAAAIRQVLDEASQLRAIFVAALATARRRFLQSRTS